jgi:blue copper oxidase
MKVTRRQFAIGCGALASCAATLDMRFGFGKSAPFSTRLPIPMLIDAAKQGNAVNLKVRSGRHSFTKGRLARTYGYSAPVLGPVIRLRRGDEVRMTVENALDTVTTVHWHGLLVPGHSGRADFNDCNKLGRRRLMLLTLKVAIFIARAPANNVLEHRRFTGADD